MPPCRSLHWSVWLCLTVLSACGDGEAVVASSDLALPAPDVAGDLSLDAADVGTCSPADGCCQIDADCPEDGNFCNGTRYCVTASHTCALKPGSAIECPAAVAGACSTAQCDPATGKCLAEPIADGSPCSDDDTCTAGDACKAGACVPGATQCKCKQTSDCAVFEDGDVCNGTLLCDGAACKVNPATIIPCAIEVGACEVATCDKVSGTCGVAPASDAAPCDLDGLACTEDTCKQGACKPGPANATCSCLQDGDCAKFEDANACNGTLYCNKATQACQLNPASIVVCPSGKDDDCSQNTCDAKTGQCAMVAQKDGSVCADGLDCTAGDACKAGKCGFASSTCQCLTSADCAKFEDANACNGTLYCNIGVGECAVNPATVVGCLGVGDTFCHQAKCEPATGKCVLADVNEGEPCEADDTWCTAVDICTAGKCAPAMNNCPCQSDGDCAVQDDGNACNGTLYCNKATGKCLVNPATIVECATVGDSGCVKNTCEPKTGMCAPKVLAEGSACDDDGFLCSVETCSAGKCLQVSNNCLCWDNQDCAPFDDGNACNGMLFCDKTAGPPNCKVNAATVPSCPVTGAPACQIAGCLPATGKCGYSNAETGKTCDDGNACTAGDACGGGACLPGPATSCDDGNACSQDACTPLSGCTNKPLADGQTCDVGKVCAAGSCVVQTCGDCNDGNACTTDTCTGTVCSHAALPAGQPCDDGSACTEGETCSAGKCNGGVVLDCGDDELCTTSGCDPKEGCLYLQIPGCSTPLWQETFEGGTDPLKSGWEIVNWKGPGVGPEFGFDGLPNPPGSRSGVNSLNFNHNITGLYCSSQQVKIDGNAYSPVIDTTGVPPGSALKLVFWYAGTWQNGVSKSVKVTAGEGATAPAGAVTTLLSIDDYWRKKSIILDTYYSGKPMRVGFGFYTADCNSYNGNGLFIDDVQVFVVPPCTKAEECDDASACTLDGCDVPSGQCTHIAANDGDSCSDDTGCTVGDTCLAGVCSGTPKNCADSSDCTDDSCLGSSGDCRHISHDVGSSCSDGKACSTLDACYGGGKCSGAALPCPLANDNGCYLLKCDPTAGCNLPKLADGTPCYGGSCAAGVCKPAVKMMECMDVSKCTPPQDTCHTTSCEGGLCVYAALPANTPCDDINACTLAETCLANGSCVGIKASCDDDKPCTADGCDKVGGCTHAVIPGCLPPSAPLYEEHFACGGEAAGGWVVTSVPGPFWAFDDSPTTPAALSGTCSLNVSDPAGIKCAANEPKVDSVIVSPEIDASAIKPGAALRLGLWLHGEVQSAFASMKVESSVDAGKTWQPLQTPASSKGQWLASKLDLYGVVGQKFRIRFRYATVGCPAGANVPPPLLIDDVRVFIDGCSKDSDCDDKNACTTDTCNGASQCVYTHPTCT